MTGPGPRARIAIVSTAVPPDASGQARVLGHLVRGRPGPCYLLLCDRLGFLERVPAERRCGEYVALGEPATALPRGARLLPASVRGVVGLVRATLRRAAEIRRVIEDRGVVALVACTGSPFDLPAAYLACRQTRRPLVAYLFDDPVLQWPTRPLRHAARLWERLWSRRAAAVIVPNETLAGDVGRRHGRAVAVIRNAIEPAAFAGAPSPWPARPGEALRIVYTGSVYHAQGDAFVNLVQALGTAGGRYALHVYTSQPAEALREHGLAGEHVVRHAHIEGDGVYAVQQEADVLFLPLAFRSSIQEVVHSSAPAKLGEYLASGRPVLVHAPRGAFVSWFVREHGAGVVVDEPDPGTLAAALDRIAGDAALREELRERAQVAARQFDAEIARRRFEAVLDDAVARGWR